MIRWKTDVAIVGAGAAGLAAANALIASGCDVTVVEARDRIGGRAFTIVPPNGHEAELGAEFIHGKPDEVLALVRATGAAALDTVPGMFEFRNGALVESPDIWELAQRIFRHVDPRAPDRSVDAFLDAVAPSLAGDADKARIKMLIEGFDAARTADAGVIAIAEEWESETNSTASRPSSGYAPLFAHLAAPVQSRIRFGCIVEAIRSQERVMVRGTQYGSAFELAADQCIVTVPAGVLRAGSIVFEPALSGELRAAIDSIVMGPVVKLILDFDRAFWETAEEGRFADAAFFRHPGAFQAFWTLLPKRIPRLTAWSGGVAAERLGSCDVNVYVER
ncbi:MAG: FAD-dependent oxidoreductase, partial [Candidatus Eremiobacteraeota bacterium]|nr:FAD-dependent oxidoreductase [Candidatus Eremiobacteraeota bacterium]